MEVRLLLRYADFFDIISEAGTHLEADSTRLNRYTLLRGMGF